MFTDFKLFEFMSKSQRGAVRSDELHVRSRSVHDQLTAVTGVAKLMFCGEPPVLVVSAVVPLL